MSIDFDRIRREYPLPDVISASGIKVTKNGNEYEACCPFHSEKTPSFRAYNKGTWKYFCFGCGANGDVLDYVKERYQYATTGEAAKFLIGEDAARAPVDLRVQRETTNPYDGYDITKPPEDAKPIRAGEKTPPLLNPKRVDAATGKPKTTVYTPSMVFPYRTRKGQLIGYVLRVEFDDKKVTPGIWWTKNKAAKFEGWSHGSYPAPRPLYGLEHLDEHPDWQVLIVEGEKCKDAAAEALAARRIIPVSWMGGGKSIAKVHWRSLAGRSVVIWPDNDREGWKTVLGWCDKRGQWHQGIVEHLWTAGVRAIKIIHITPDTRPPDWDIADAWHGTKAEGFKDKLDARAIEIIMRDRIQEWTRDRFQQFKTRQIAEAGKPKVIEHDPVRGDDNPDRQTVTEEEGGDRQEDQGDGGSDGRDLPVEDDRGSQVDREEPRRVGRGFEIDAENWRQHLIMKADGDGLKASSLQNCALLLQYEARFAGVFAWNEFAKEVYLQRRPPWDISGHPARWTPRKMIEPDVTSAACWLEYCGMSPKSNEVGKVIQRVAQHNAYNPVTERLTSLLWDGVPRLSGGTVDEGELRPWLSEYMDAPNTYENRAFGRKWLIGAVARAFQPGCKVDTMLVLEGKQGLKKSTALRIIADAVVPGVFTDEISDPNSKDAGLQMQGAFIIEIAELDAFRRAEITQIKAWLSRQTDRFRRPYGKIIEEFPRSCVFAGTVNPIGLGYLKDPSGGRRFWPTEVGEIDLDRLRKDAPQLWAEAVAAYNDGEVWWLEGDEIAYAKIAQEQRYEEDPYGQMIDEFVRTRTEVTIMEVMQMMDIPKERRNAIVNRRIGSHLHSRGWKREVEHDGAVHYVRPERMI